MATKKLHNLFYWSHFMRHDEETAEWEGRLAHFFNIIVLNNALLLNHNSFYQMEYLSQCFSTIASWERFFLFIPPIWFTLLPINHSTEL
ncbi:Uncharacterised protein [Escherichia coli]|uniref:Uncharacterized protein n=1 Tax=Escherichia coli TaxID=562 RepID=A0A376MMW3_ECOLX|nr:Uncharacterised protein [Escherichia coli]